MNICICNGDIDNSTLKYYLPFLGIIIVALIAGLIGLLKIKLDVNYKARIVWIEELRDSASKYLTDSDVSLMLFSIFVSQRVHNNLAYGSNQDRANYDKYMESCNKADIQSNLIRLLFNPQNKLHDKAEKLLLEREESIAILFNKTGAINTVIDIENINNEIRQLRELLPDIIKAIQDIVVEESKKSRKIFI